MGERQLCKLDVVGSIPSASTNPFGCLQELIRKHGCLGLTSWSMLFAL